MIRSTGNTKAAARCASCGKPTSEPKKGLCQGCYLRGHRGHTLGTTCAVCGLEDLRVLRRHKLARFEIVRVPVQVTLCANDAAIAGRRLLTLEELTLERFPPRDRRRADRRRGDRRGPRERRTRVDVEKMLEDEKRTAERRR